MQCQQSLSTQPVTLSASGVWHLACKIQWESAAVLSDLQSTSFVKVRWGCACSSWPLLYFQCVNVMIPFYTLCILWNCDALGTAACCCVASSSTLEYLAYQKHHPLSAWDMITSGLAQNQKLSSKFFGSSWWLSSDHWTRWKSKQPARMCTCMHCNRKFNPESSKVGPGFKPIAWRPSKVAVSQ